MFTTKEEIKKAIETGSVFDCTQEAIEGYCADEGLKVLKNTTDGYNYLIKTCPRTNGLYVEDYKYYSNGFHIVEKPKPVEHHSSHTIRNADDDDLIAELEDRGYNVNSNDGYSYDSWSDVVDAVSEECEPTQVFSDNDLTEWADENYEISVASVVGYLNDDNHYEELANDYDFDVVKMLKAIIKVLDDNEDKDLIEAAEKYVEDNEN